MSKRAKRRPYRVVFTPGGHPDSGRRGIIVARDEEAAHREARKIARAGGHAEVQQVSESGHRRILAVYPPKNDGAETLR